MFMDLKLPWFTPQQLPCIEEGMANTHMIHFHPVIVLNHFMAPGVVDPSTMGGANAHGNTRTRTNELSHMEKNNASKGESGAVSAVHFDELDDVACVEVTDHVNGCDSLHNTTSFHRCVGVAQGANLQAIQTPLNDNSYSWDYSTLGNSSRNMT